jgi:glycosyltransferase involved in cell wall biosynthesis
MFISQFPYLRAMISAIICTYNRERFLPKLFQSIKEQTLSKEQFEVVVINNNSTDNTKHITLKFHKENPDIKLIYAEETNQGLSYSRNRGIVESKGEYLTFLDDDAFLDKNFLKEIVAFFQTNTNVLAIGGKILLAYETFEPEWYTNYLGPLLGYFNMGDKVMPFPSGNYPRGSNMSFRRKVFNKYGFFDVKLGRVGRILAGGEEKEFFSRMKPDYSKVWYVPRAVVFHFVPQERTTEAFIRNQALGTGRSEAIRIKSKGTYATLCRYLQEVVKWGGSLILFFYYLLTFEPAKGIMIVKFRRWVTQGLLEKVT